MATLRHFMKVQDDARRQRLPCRLREDSVHGFPVSGKYFLGAVSGAGVFQKERAQVFRRNGDAFDADTPYAGAETARVFRSAASP